MPLTPIKPSERIDAWRERVPSRLERRDPFEGDGFEERPSTRLVSLSPATFVFFFAHEYVRPSSGLIKRPVEKKRKGIFGIFNGKRKRDEEESIPREPIHLNFLFVGSKSAGQTSLLLPTGKRSALVRIDTLSAQLLPVKSEEIVSFLERWKLILDSPSFWRYSCREIR
ncbi:hypothetical protein CEP53_011210 [Fusarium sp. AF-6]|nr:hypothetical protein CEP53_011210 [Fusarium sp. AF-6]